MEHAWDLIAKLGVSGFAVTFFLKSVAAGVENSALRLEQFERLERDAYARRHPPSDPFADE